MTEVPLSDLLSATRGEIRGRIAAGTVFRRVEPDPGDIAPGDLYLPLSGERVDGHEHTVVAALRGASAALVARRWADELAELPLPLVVVDDPLTALHSLAAARRRNLRTKVVGVTGSVGKTSTKELLAAVLARNFRTFRSPGNRNNEIGLPLALLEIAPETDVAVLEMAGGHAFGELRLLAQIAQPQVAVVTNIYPVHFERLGSLDAIARAKAELVDSLPADGLAVLNGDDARVRAMAARTRARVLTYGRGPANDVRAEEVSTRGLKGSSLTVVAGGVRQRLDVQLPGPHVPELALAAATVAHALGMSLADIGAAFRNTHLAIGPRTVRGLASALLIDDTYNASPPSVRSALQLLAETRARRRLAVLGDMLELGPLAESEHRAIGRQAAAITDLLVTIGPFARLIAAEAVLEAERRGLRPPETHCFELTERDAVLTMLRAVLRRGDVALVKGSHALRLDEIVAALRQSAAGEQGR